LQEKGLVEKVMAIPTEFKEALIQYSVRILIERQIADSSRQPFCSLA
jgi:hypothetical protein